MSIKENIQHFQEKLEGTSCQLIAVSKMHSVALIQEAYEAGQRAFGENKVQELVAKQPELSADIQWHLIGHLQTNKVKYIVPFVHMVQSVDSLKLLQEINKQALKHNRVMHCLLQFHIAEEDSKFGLTLEEAQEFLATDTCRAMENVRICGVMGVATFTQDQNQLKKEFRALRSIFQTLKHGYFSSSEYFKEISMGMSSDYELAIAEGSTMVRVGSALFGSRSYPV